MSFLSSLVILVALLVASARSCKPAAPKGAWISDISLLANSDLLLTISVQSSSDWHSDKYCIVFDIETRKTIGVDADTDSIIDDAYKGEDCDKYEDDVIPWPTETYIPNTIITSIDDNNNPYVIHGERNAELFSVDLHLNVTITNDYFKYWTMDSILTTFVALTTNGYELSRIYAIQFSDALDNSNFTLFEVNINSTFFDWILFDMESDTDIVVFEEYNVLSSPLTCCLCSTTFLSYYAFDQKSHSFSFAKVAYDAVIDVAEDNAYAHGYKSLVVYDLVDRSSVSYTPDISASHDHHSSHYGAYISVMGNTVLWLFLSVVWSSC